MASLLIACNQSPDFPSSYETEHLRIRTDLEHPLCAGDLVAFEGVVRRVEEELGLSMDGKTSVYIWSDEAWPAVGKKYCWRGALGCTSYSDNAIHTSWSSVEHELVPSLLKG